MSNDQRHYRSKKKVNPELPDEASFIGPATKNAFTKMTALSSSPQHALLSEDMEKIVNLLQTIKDNETNEEDCKSEEEVAALEFKARRLSAREKKRLLERMFRKVKRSPPQSLPISPETIQRVVSMEEKIDLRPPTTNIEMPESIDDDDYPQVPVVSPDNESTQHMDSNFEEAIDETNSITNGSETSSLVAERERPLQIPVNTGNNLQRQSQSQRNRRKGSLRDRLELALVEFALSLIDPCACEDESDDQIFMGQYATA